jgi:Protein of unknown function (DUF3999)
MSVRHVAAFLLCVLFAEIAHAAVSDYAYAWPLRGEGDSAAWQVELTPEIYATLATEDLRDVEIVNAAGEPVPIATYRIPAAAAIAHDDFVELPIFTLPAAKESAGDDSIQLHIERSADGKLRRLGADVGTNPKTAATMNAALVLDASTLHDALTSVRFDWTGGGDAVTARFAISASDDLQHWRPLVNEASVLRLRQDGNVLERHEVALANARASYLLLRRLDDGPALPDLKISARIVSRSTPALPARLWLQATLDGSDTHHFDHSVPAGDGTRPLAYRYHLPAPLPASAVKLELADDNSLVAGNVLSAEPGGAAPTWITRASFVAFRLRQGDAIASNDEFLTNAGRDRARDWRVELATPLDRAPTLSIAYRPDRFVFLAQGTGPYRIVAGSARARHGDYPIDAALAQLRSKLGADWQPPLIALGARETLQGEHALVIAAPVKPAPDWRTWLLWGVLVAAAAIVGGLALSLLRKK